MKQKCYKKVSSYSDEGALSVTQLGSLNCKLSTTSPAKQKSTSTHTRPCKPDLVVVDRTVDSLHELMANLLSIIKHPILSTQFHRLNRSLPPPGMLTASSQHHTTWGIISPHLPHEIMTLLIISLITMLRPLPCETPTKFQRNSNHPITIMRPTSRSRWRRIRMRKMECK